MDADDAAPARGLEDLGRDGAGVREDALAPPADAELEREERDAARRVAAHRRARAVGIQEDHFVVEVGDGVGEAQREHAFASYAEAPGREPRHQRRVLVGEGAGAVVQNQEIVARAVHFREFDLHVALRPSCGDLAPPVRRRLPDGCRRF